LLIPGRMLCASRHHAASRPPLPLNLLYDVEADPSETKDLAQSNPDVVAQLLLRLQSHNATNVPCCICTGSGQTEEMKLPPVDGYWTSFRNQSDNPDPNCALMNEPEWRLQM